MPTEATLLSPNSVFLNTDLFLHPNICLKSAWWGKQGIKYTAGCIRRMLPLPQDTTQIPKALGAGENNVLFLWSDRMIVFSLPEHTFLRKREPRVIGCIFKQAAASCP